MSADQDFRHEQYIRLMCEILEAVRALKPAPTFDETPNEKAWRERAVSAERALLDYEGKEILYSGRTRLAQAEAENVRLERLVKGLHSRIDILEEASTEEQAELKRFRDREKNVQWLIEFAAPYVSTNGARERFAAVRDFEVTPEGAGAAQP